MSRLSSTKLTNLPGSSGCVALCGVVVTLPAVVGEE